MDVYVTIFSLISESCVILLQKLENKDSLKVFKPLRLS